MKNNYDIKRDKRKFCIYDSKRRCFYKEIEKNDRFFAIKMLIVNVKHNKSTSALKI